MGLLKKGERSVMKTTATITAEILKVVKVALRRNFSIRFFIVFAFSKSLSGTYSPVRAVLSNKRRKMDFFTVFGRNY